MAIVRWEPARELASMEIDRLNRMFASLYGDDMQRSGWMPAVDIYETPEHEVVLKAELPEVKRETATVYRSEFWEIASDHRAVFVTIVPVEKRR